MKLNFPKEESPNSVLYDDFPQRELSEIPQSFIPSPLFASRLENLLIEAVNLTSPQMSGNRPQVVPTSIPPQIQNSISVLALFLTTPDHLRRLSVKKKLLKLEFAFSRP